MSDQGNPQGFPNISQPFVDPKGFINRSWRQLLLSLWNRTGAAQGATLVPSGTVSDFAGPTAPVGWLTCDGSAVPRDTYANLFIAIGTTWGAGDGSSTFNLPDLRNRITRGAGVSGVGTTGGADSLTLSVAQLPAHNHPVVDPTHVHGITDPGHLHTATTSTSINTAGAATGSAAAGNTGSATTGITINSAATGVTVGDTGSGDSVPTLPAYATLQKIIKT